MFVFWGESDPTPPPPPARIKHWKEVDLADTPQMDYIEEVHAFCCRSYWLHSPFTTASKGRLYLTENRLPLRERGIRKFDILDVSLYIYKGARRD